MEIIEILNLLFTTVATFFVSTIKVMFSISNAVDSVKEGMVAAVLGVSVGFISLVSLLITIIKFLVKHFGN